MKRLLIIGGSAVGVLVVAVVAVVIYVYSSLDSLVKQAVEKYGSEATQTEVKLKEVKLNITSGQGALHGLKVGNPKGFDTPAAFQLGSISVNLDTSTVTGNPIVIKQIAIEAPEVTYELTPAGSNVGTIQKNVDSYANKFGGGKQAPQPKAKTEDDGKKLVIETLTIKGGKVTVAASILPGQGRSMTAPLPDITLRNIGKDSGGATPAEVSAKVLTALNESAIKAAGSIGVGATLDSLQKSLGGAAAGAMGKGGEAAKGATEEAGKTMKKLLGN